MSFLFRSTPFIFLIFLVACNPGSTAQSEAASDDKGSMEIANDINNQWLQTMILFPDSIHNWYAGDAIKITSKGDVIKGPMQIQEVLQNEGLVLDTILMKRNVEANNRYPFEYEISTLRQDDDSYLDQLLIWKKEKDSKKRLLEFMAPANEWNPEDKEMIDKARERWVTLCNQHDAKALVEEMYTPNAIYYNHKPVVVGHDDISREYQYMNNPKYTLNLSPIHLELVNKSLAFEIGQCSGSYPGKYIIVWQKGTDGKWRVLMDSNI